jgi:hypothetical protein
MRASRKISQVAILLIVLAVNLWISPIGGPVAVAQPFGVGKYNENVPYGSATSLTISTSGNVAISVTPTDAGTLGTATNNVTITSTDVVGYQLYINSLSSTDMANGAYTIPASANVVAGALVSDTWGYNTDASANFVGMTTTQEMIKNAIGPFSSGDTTVVTYGVKVDNAKPAGNYSTTVVYTVAPQTM